MTVAPYNSSASKIAKIVAAYRAGEGGYNTLAKRFGVSRETVRGYILGPCGNDPTWPSCGRKRRYETADAADVARAALIADRGTDRERALQVYSCAICAGFHLGGRSARLGGAPSPSASAP